MRKGPRMTFFAFDNAAPNPVAFSCCFVKVSCPIDLPKAMTAVSVSSSGIPMIALIFAASRMPRISESQPWFFVLPRHFGVLPTRRIQRLADDLLDLSLGDLARDILPDAPPRLNQVFEFHVSQPIFCNCVKKLQTAVLSPVESPFKSYSSTFRA